MALRFLHYGGSPPALAGHHNIERLARRFRELHAAVPAPDIAWEWRMGGIPTDQLFRYGADKTGATVTKEHFSFSPPIWIRWIERAEDDFRRIWSAIS